MDGAADATAAALGAWASIRGFFTPATLFLVVNLVIGTIALTSRSHQRRRRGNAHGDAQHHEQQPFHHAQHQENQHHQEPSFHQVQQQENQYYDQQHHEQQYVPPPPATAPLARTSSVLDRLRSIGLYRFRSGDFPPEYATAAPDTDSRDVVTPAPAPTGEDAQYERSRSEPAPMREEMSRPAPSRMRKAELPPAPTARVVRAAVLEEDDAVEEYARADEFTASNFDQQQQQQPALQHEEEEEEEEHYYREEYVPPLRSAPLARAPSVLERLRSFSLSRFRSGDLAHEHAAAAVAELESNHTQKQAAQYSRSRSEPAWEQSKKGKKQLQQQGTAEPKMSKSSSEARKPAAAAEEAEEGGVDARADDFINSFRKQLQLQRLNSLLNYKEMLNRGT